MSGSPECRREGGDTKIHVVELLLLQFDATGLRQNTLVRSGAPTAVLTIFNRSDLIPINLKCGVPTYSTKSLFVNRRKDRPTEEQAVECTDDQAEHLKSGTGSGNHRHRDSLLHGHHDRSGD